MFNRWLNALLIVAMFVLAAWGAHVLSYAY